ncbi:hypothetical protein [Actinotalea subterranea]|uniref:hypothetical protein n=1 Tax=Actinotalea subterranea TaxID=2607497 RepID=UPI0011EBBA0D|nr:hypothetical protein [Actinotalea subterranea]
MSRRISTGTAGDDSPSAGASVALRAAVVLVLAEAVSLGVLGLVWTVRLVAEGTPSLGVSLFLIVFALGVAAALVGLARLHRQGRRGARAPLVTWQVLQGATAVTVLQVGPAVATAAVAWVALAAAVVTTAVLVRPVGTEPVTGS